MDAKKSKQTSRVTGPKKTQRANSARARKVKQMFEEWLQDSSGYDEQTWPELKRALNENHSRSHKLIDE